MFQAKFTEVFKSREELINNHELHDFKIDSIHSLMFKFEIKILILKISDLFFNSA